MKVSTAIYSSNIPHAAIIYGKFTQPFGAGVSREDAVERLATIIDLNGPSGYTGEVADELAEELLRGIDFPNDGCQVSFFIYATEEEDA